MIVTRFAPSPTGFLHLGHVYSLICSYEYSKNHNGKFVLRIEDIDFTRCKNFYAEQIINDINWLKIPFIRTKDQSMRKNQYSLALDYLIPIIYVIIFAVFVVYYPITYLGTFGKDDF